MSDHPFFDVAADAQEKMREGFTINQQFTCHRCRTRQTIDEPNRFFQRGICEKCFAETNLLVTGCNYVAMISVHPGRAH